MTPDKYYSRFEALFSERGPESPPAASAAAPNTDARPNLLLEYDAQKICPYVGRWDDPATRHGYATSENACYAQGKPSEVEVTMQDTFCVSGRFRSCQRYIQAIVEETTAAQSNGSYSAP